MSATCLIHLAALVATFRGPQSLVNFTNPSVSGELSSMVLQFKTLQSNTQIAKISGVGHMFAVSIINGYLIITYSLADIGNGSVNISQLVVNTDNWFVLNVTSHKSDTHIRLTKSNVSTAIPCTADYETTKNITLLGQGFLSLFKEAGVTLGGKTNRQLLKPFDGCMGTVILGNYLLELSQSSLGKLPSNLTRNESGITKGCPCGQSSCKNGLNHWDQTLGYCDCKCSFGYFGEHCQNQTTVPPTNKSDDNVDAEFLFLVVGIAAGVLVLVSVVVCVVLYCRRTSSAMFGVYNPKTQEQVQGQQMNMSMKVPPPEKLI